jgi:hypothetical protein
MPVGIFVVLLWQGLHGRPFDRLEQRATTDADAAHLTPIHALDRRRDRRVALGQREVSVPGEFSPKVPVENSPL